MDTNNSIDILLLSLITDTSFQAMYDTVKVDPHWRLIMVIIAIYSLLSGFSDTGFLIGLLPLIAALEESSSGFPALPHIRRDDDIISRLRECYLNSFGDSFCNSS